VPLQIVKEPPYARSAKLEPPVARLLPRVPLLASHAGQAHTLKKTAAQIAQTALRVQNCSKLKLTEENITMSSKIVETALLQNSIHFLETLSVICAFQQTHRVQRVATDAFPESTR
jgi:hypothetical protein